MGIWLCFCLHRWAFDNGFRPHRRKFDCIFLKSQIPGGSPRGGMIAVGIDSYKSIRTVKGGAKQVGGGWVWEHPQSSDSRKII
jgi:hypothetical protein